MKRIRFRSALLNGVLLLLAGVAWFYLAPGQVGGFTNYVVTHGVSMEPRFHSGDLALVRPADHYRVGEIVAYHSSILREVVLHRIVGIRNGHYIFKGDNNNFLDPVHPTRAELIGTLWVHVPGGGVVLAWLHTPAVDAVLCATLGLLLLWGIGAKRQWRRRRQGSRSGPPRQGPPLVSTPRDTGTARSVNLSALLTASAIAAAVFLVLGVLAFIRPAAKAETTSYSQQATFGYSARVRPGPVYPTGRIKTADPVFLSIVHHLDVHIAYSFTSAARSNVAGTEEVLLKLDGPSGWTRNLVLAPPTRFVGHQTSTTVALDLRQLQSLMAQIEKLTNNPAFASFAFTVQPVVHVSGTLTGQPITTSYEPGLSFQLEAGQLQPAAAAAPTTSTPGAGSTSSPANYTPSQTGHLPIPATSPATVTALGVSAEVSLLRWIAVIGLVLSLAAAVFFYLRKRAEPFQETAHIQSQYGHMIVPIVGGEDLGWPPVDVPNIKALVKLAESGQRLILHNRSNDVDTYMVNEEGTVYRYQVKPSKVVWGEWSAPAEDLEEAASEIARVAAEATPSASSAT